MQEQQYPAHKGLRKGLYLIPTAFTAANLGMGFFAVLYSMRAFQISDTNPQLASTYLDYASIAIGLAILFDTLDGRLARMTRTATELGVQFDSLADVLTFGIAPIALIYSWAIGSTLNEGTSAYGLGIFLLFMYLMCGAFRLARFNIQATRPHVLIEGTPKLDKKNFVGLPIPPAAGLLAALVHFSPAPLNTYGEGLSIYYTYLVMILLAILGILMVSTIRYSSFKDLSLGKRNLYLVLMVAAIGMLIWLYSRYVLILLASLYVAHGFVFYVFRVIFIKRHLHTEAVEPDSAKAAK
ncbi:MAG TPA: CDP-alcohol phosphatidyltransferase family protein [Pyrinomonadaceae bacterium]|jgi:CDP-diacylglycerol--serine O-phosphatidyltransferase|nr:CDP-alcohol phosphatidyltransferase family protein [Pyrinomonadaceae bacterium]